MKRPSYLHLHLYGLQPTKPSLLLIDDADPRRGTGLCRWRALAWEQFRALIGLSSTQERRRRVDIVLKEMSRTRLVGFWFTAVAVVVAWVVAAGVNVATSTGALLLALCLVPPADMLLVWRGAPPPTAGELLYSVNKQ